MASNALKARNRLIERKRNYLFALDDMRDDEIAREISHWESCDPRAGSFQSWALGQAIAELDHRI